MKKLIIFGFILFISCSKDEVSKQENKYIGTKWTATDDIGELIYGKTCTTSVEFLTENTCQQIEVRNVKNFGFSGTYIKQGTYLIKNDSTFWTIEKITIGGIATGTVLSTNMRTISGGKRVYSKM